MPILIVDTSGLIALLDRDEQWHGAVADFVDRCDDLLVVSPFILAEADYLLGKYTGSDRQRKLLDDFEQGAYELASFERSELTAARKVIDHYSDLKIGLADASLVVLAHRYNTDRVLTLDQRHFRALRTLTGGSFRLMPFDSD